MLYYERLQSAYGWTVEAIDNTDMRFILDQLIVIDKKNHVTKRQYIEDVMP